MGNRNSANIEEPTILEFEFKKNSILADPASINKVTIHASETDAQNNANIITTISSSNILHTDTGCYSYTIPIISTAGTYYDKVFVTPVSDATEVSYISSFTVSSITYTGAASSIPSNIALCRIYGKIIDASGNILKGALVFCRPYAMPGTSSTALLSQDGMSVITDATGSFYIDLIRNTEFTLTVKEIGLHTTIKIPDKSRCSLLSLMANEQATTPTNPGDTNW